MEKLLLYIYILYYKMKIIIQYVYSHVYAGLHLILDLHAYREINIPITRTTRTQSVA